MLLCRWCSALSASAGLHLFVIFIKQIKHLARRRMGLNGGRHPAENVPGVFCCEGKAIGVTKGLEMFRSASY